MKTFFATINCPNKGRFKEKTKANSEQEARDYFQAKYPNCKIISVKELLLG